MADVHHMQAAPGKSPETARAQDTGPLLIAGAGIGGLAAALALARVGIASHILERRGEFAEEGAGIQIGPNGTRILAALGVADLLRPHVAEPPVLRVMDGVSGAELTRLPLGSFMASRHGAPYWVAHRRDLHDALLTRVRQSPMISLTLNAPIQGVRSHGEDAEVLSTNGRAWMAKGLIAADGLWSQLRDGIGGAVDLRFMGKCAFRAVLDADAAGHDIEPGATHIWLRPKEHVVHYPVRSGKEVALVAILSDANPGQTWNAPVNQNDIAARTRLFPGSLRMLMEAPAMWRKWPLYEATRMGSWVNGRTALLGDAAHPVLPFLAQGAVLALEDAVVLARCLADASCATLPDALRRYEALRRPRARAVAAASRENGRIYHLDGIMRTARNAAMRLAPPQRLIARYDWLYGWQDA